MSYFSFCYNSRAGHRKQAAVASFSHSTIWMLDSYWDMQSLEQDSWLADNLPWELGKLQWASIAYIDRKLTKEMVNKSHTVWLQRGLASLCTNPPDPSLPYNHHIIHHCWSHKKGKWRGRMGPLPPHTLWTRTDAWNFMYLLLRFRPNFSLPDFGIPVWKMKEAKIISNPNGSSPKWVRVLCFVLFLDHYFLIGLKKQRRKDY